MIDMLLNNHGGSTKVKNSTRSNLRNHAEFWGRKKCRPEGWDFHATEELILQSYKARIVATLWSFVESEEESALDLDGLKTWISIVPLLLKGMVMRLVDWTRDFVEEITADAQRTSKRGTKRKRDGRLIEDSSYAVQLDHRFGQVPLFHEMNRFSCFSQVKQWGGNEQKAMIKQLVPVFVLLLKTGAGPAAMHCTRAILDFVMLASYTLLDKQTLGYMTAALERVDKLKPVFKNSRLFNKETGERHFNFPKLHVMSHYVDFIHLYGSAQGFDTSYSKAAHKTLVKEFFNRTNKNPGYGIQILHHNTRRQNVAAMKDILLFTQSRPQSQADRDDQT